MRYLFAILILFINTIALAETRNYELTDIRNGSKYALILEEDLANQEMRLYLCFRNNTVDSLHVPLVKQIESVDVSQGKFLKVEFRRGGGSEVKMRFTSIYCMADSKIVTCLSQISKIYSHITETFIPKFDRTKDVKYHEDYIASINLLKSGKEYPIKVSESYLLKSVIDSVHNEKWSNKVNLKSNKELCVYYSIQKSVHGFFQIFYLNNTEESKEINDKLLMVETKKFKYFWIDKKWFYMDENKLIEI